ncbi:secretory pathway protein YSY6 [Beauveria bassiana ARSEF 2860]|uniref:Stress-associated endoplasmic reticulum protein n=1 Tax=Beauveria bassiana (strain ARSEF 2860) TaxID=655819 RepID=J4KMF3_BEAB2|nr:secretory pathway protein YSY6 [Beauveria bassiana ARSEF 2860]EJP63854.1 secretory pathway protein YSY6 [Beauveria bassiana ARSEF 2860]
MVRHAQTPEQRRRNAKFAKDQESRMGKSIDQIKKREKAVQKPTISPFWIVLLAFVVFGGLIFEVIARWWGQ